MSAHEEQGGPRDPREQVGSLSEEAARLLGALLDRARDVDEHVATGSSECAYCPICRTVLAVRQTSPEVRAHLASAATSLLQAAATVLATHVPEGHRRGDVQRIDLEDLEDLEDPDDLGDLGPDENPEDRA